MEERQVYRFDPNKGDGWKGMQYETWQDDYGRNYEIVDRAGNHLDSKSFHPDVDWTVIQEEAIIKIHEIMSAQAIMQSAMVDIIRTHEMILEQRQILNELQENQKKNCQRLWKSGMDAHAQVGDVLHVQLDGQIHEIHLDEDGNVHWITKIKIFQIGDM